jgi:hypothetical protein
VTGARSAGPGSRAARSSPPLPVGSSEVNNGWARWGYTFEPDNGGTRLTESWEFLPPGIAGFRERFGARADAEIVKRQDAAKSGIPATLAAIKKAAEAP